MKKHAHKGEKRKPTTRSRINPPVTVPMPAIKGPTANDLAMLTHAQHIRPEQVLQLQQQFGNSFVQKHVIKHKRSMNGALRKVEKRQSLLDRIVVGLSKRPPGLAYLTYHMLKKVKALEATMYSGNRFWASLQDVSGGMAKLIADLKKMPATSQTTADQRARHKDLLARWREIKTGVEADNRKKLYKQLALAKVAAHKMRVQMLFAYHDIFGAGQEPGKVKMGNFGTVRSLAERVVDLLKDINDANAGAASGYAGPLLPLLKRTVKIANQILNWKVTSSLAPEASQDMAFVQNIINSFTAGLSVVGLGRFLPLFGHLPILLNRLAMGWDKVVLARKEQSRIWWNVSLRTKQVHRTAKDLPGGAQVENYMKQMFKLSAPPTKVPSDHVLDFFYDNKKMIDMAMKEVMGQAWNKLPTKSKWIFLAKTNPNKINQWVFYNRVTLWHLIYGRGHDLPTQTSR